MLKFNESSRPYIFNETKKIYRALDALDFTELMRLKSSDLDFDTKFYLSLRGLMEEHWLPYENKGKEPPIFKWKSYERCLTEYKKIADGYESWQIDNENKDKGISVTIEFPMF